MSKRRRARASSVKAGFWTLLEEAYPASALWWDDRPAGSVTGGPWTEAAFMALADRFRALARALEGRTGEEALWRRHAARALVALRAGTWRPGHLPLQTVRRTLLAIAVDHALGGASPDWEALMAPVPAWLEAVEIPHGKDPRVSAAAAREVVSIRRVCGRVDMPAGVWEAVEVALADYLRRLDRAPGDPVEPVPWARAATVDVDAWRRRRAAFVPPGSGARWSGARSPLAPIAPRPTVAVDALDAAVWVAREPERGFAAGPTAREAFWTAELRAFWLERAEWDPLTWALADPLYVEGALEAVLAEIAGDRGRPADERRRMRAFLAREEGIALADAWLWLEGGDPSAVAEWLAPWCGKDDAAGLVGLLALNPGRLVERERIRGEVADELKGRAGSVFDWEGWRRGPAPP